MNYRIAITGSSGFLGNHLKNYFNNNENFYYIELNKNFNDSLFLLKNGDTLIHAASVHRDVIPENVYLKNMEINNTLIKNIKKNNLSLNIIFISSIQESMNNPYGRSKKDGSILFEEYCKNCKTNFIKHSLPNIFGPQAIPNKTSFIATFCYNINNNIKSIIKHNEVYLIHINDVVFKIAELRWENVIFNSISINVADVYFLLENFKKCIDNNEIVLYKSKFELDLYNTFISYKNYKLN